MNSLYKVNLKCVVLTTQEQYNKQYVLSLHSEDFQPPILVLDETIISNIETHLIKFLQQFVFTSELELMPQLIELNKSDENTNEIDIIYGSVVKYTSNINNCHWLEFSLAKEAPYTNTILHVIQKL